MKVSRRVFCNLSLGFPSEPLPLASWARVSHPRRQGAAQSEAFRSPVQRSFHRHCGRRACSRRVYGGVENKDYIIEAVGCGCAFLDYDNDGWMDIFVLCGTRMKERRREQPIASTRTIATARSLDVTDKAGLRDVGWASGVCVGDYNNDGFEDLFCTYFGQNKLYRNNGDGTFTDVTKTAGLWNDRAALWRRLHLCRLQPRRPSRSICFQLFAVRSPGVPKPGAEQQLQLEGCARRVRAARTASRISLLVPTTMEMERSPMSA